MKSFREICDALMARESGLRPEYDSESGRLSLELEGDTLVVSESEGKVAFEVSRENRTARRELDYDEGYRYLSALVSGDARLEAWFPYSQTKKKTAQTVGVVFGVLLALGAAFCSFAVLMGSLVFGSESILGDIAMQIFFVGMLAAGIVLAVSSARSKVDIRNFFGIGVSYTVVVTLLSLILGIWSTRPGDAETPLEAYIALTIAFGLFVVGGIAMMIYTFRDIDRDSKFVQKPRLRVLLSMENTRRLIEAVRGKTERQAIRVKPDFARQPTLFQSKLGGLPYWDTSLPYPCADSGEKLTMLAQFNLSELPENSYFPGEGMLQFFVLADVEYGVGGGAKVVYHKTVDRNVREKTIREMGVPSSLDSDSGEFPVCGEIAVDFELRTVCMNPADNRYDKMLASFAEEMGLDMLDGVSSGSLYTGRDGDPFERVYESAGGTWLAGYPYFTQYDPRDDSALERYDLLLLQLDTEDDRNYPDKYVMWGDSGVGNFFINSDALRRMELDDILYTWDCC